LIAARALFFCGEGQYNPLITHQTGKLVDSSSGFMRVARQVKFGTMGNRSDPSDLGLRREF
jgi:hypothetical protein